MKIAINDITKIVNDSKKMGYDIKVSDIAYVILLRNFKDKEVAYTVLFGKNSNEKENELYDKSEKIKFLKKYIKVNYIKEKDKDPQYADLTFQENKDAMIKMLDELKVSYDEGKLEYKDYAKMVTDLRTRLNDKFAVSEKHDENMIQVFAKYNHICEWTHKECFLQTKEYAMQHWDLVERKE